MTYCTVVQISWFYPSRKVQLLNLFFTIGAINRILWKKQSHCFFAVIRNCFTCYFIYAKHLRKKRHNVLAYEKLEPNEIKRGGIFAFTIHDGYCTQQRLCGANLEVENCARQRLCRGKFRSRKLCTTAPLWGKFRSRKLCVTAPLWVKFRSSETVHDSASVGQI